jgi:hypothetical protein
MTSDMERLTILYQSQMTRDMIRLSDVLSVTDDQEYD